MLAKISPDSTMKLKGKKLLEQHDKTMYRAAKDGAIAYSTLHRWISDADNVEHVSLKVLLGFLRGLGLSDAEIESLPLGEVFDLTD